jgi:hypothetical protein
MIKLHGYRVWWVDLYYGIFAFGIVGGSISHYRMVRRASHGLRPGCPLQALPVC